MKQVTSIGLVNNMGDEALSVTERQFSDLLNAAAGDREVRLHVFAFQHRSRSPAALRYINTRCKPASSIPDYKLDGLIITGAPPQSSRLCDESYWRELVEIIDWAKSNTTSVILSCLAAHAGVLHLDGIERRRLGEKCFGVFTFTAQRDHPLVGRRGSTRVAPHARHNELLPSDLEYAGYDILTSSPRHGVDVFTKSFGSLFVFLQGHPEYDATRLAREYRRDLGDTFRHFNGDALRPPSAPKGYFAIEHEPELQLLERRVLANPSSLTAEDLSIIDARTPSMAIWRDDAVSFYRGWIDEIVAPIHPALRAFPSKTFPLFN